MNTTLDRPRSRTRAINPLQLSRVLLYLAFAIVAGAAGICYVSLKNTQHALGEKVRETERQLKEFRARNQDYDSRINSLASRTALHRKVESGFVTMIPVPLTAIARLTPPAITTDNVAARTASVGNPVLHP
jgi:cell division protein FtsB